MKIVHSKKPLGLITRGKTTRNRLRQTDHFLLLYDRNLISSLSGSIVVDLGYGFEAVTTLEMAERFWMVNPCLRVVGVEIDPERVLNAKPFESPQLEFRHGGFNIPLHSGETIRYIRAFNVLRQYQEMDVVSSWAEMGNGVIEGGILLEGTSTPSGGIWVANILRFKNKAWEKEGLVFFTNFKQTLDLNDFKAVLPKNLIHRMIPGESIFAFFQTWQSALNNTVGEKAWGNKRWFSAAILEMSRLGVNLSTDKKLISRGFLILRSV